jgi:hypothetical protein
LSPCDASACVFEDIAPSDWAGSGKLFSEKPGGG